MAEDPVRRPGAALGYESPWQGVLFLLGFSALFALVAVVCSVLAFFLRGWQTGCLVLVGVVAPAVLVNLARDKVVEIAGSRARDAGAPGRPVPADAPDQPSVWVVVSALTLLLGVLGAAGMLAGLVVFLVSGWGTAFLLLGAGAAGAVVGFAPLGWLRQKRKRLPRPTPRVRAAAAELGFGDHLYGLHGSNPLFWLVMAPLVVAAVVGLMGGLTWLVGDGEGLEEVAGSLLLIFGVLFLAGPYLAGMILVFMPKSLVRTHLFTGGVVQSVNGRVTSARWEDVRAVEADRRGVAVRGCWILCAADQGRLYIRADREPVGDETRFWHFCRVLIREAEQRRIPVQPVLLTETQNRTRPRD
ncbi:hypothetical protein [Streptomyces werraensis]|uniref:hypothetical protein n=1 Tax=Streptomyces werraensis TaxID=68284 RepID=UPI001CE28018